MLDPATLRGRLTLAYALALIAALILFAAIAFAIIDNAQRRSLDTQLATTARALQLVGDTADGKVKVDAKDREQFETILGAKADGAVLSPDGSVAVASDSHVGRRLAAATLPLSTPTTFDTGTDHLRVYVEPLMRDGKAAGRVLTWRDADDLEAIDRNVVLAFLIAIPLIAALATIAGSTIARRGLEPLGRIATLASNIEAHDLSRRLTLSSTGDELGRLGTTFNRMLDRLQHAFDRERRFTSDASHEIRAPLSVIRAEADLALRKERSAPEYQRALAVIAAEADELETLTRDLLAAARETSDADDGTNVVDINSVAHAVRDRMSVLAGERHVRIDSPASEPAYVLANRAMLERAVVGIAHNALKAAPPGGNVTLNVRREDGLAELSVADDGDGFSAEALERGFDRFWRDPHARASEGSGLGLALAKTVVERYGGTIVLANATPRGALVRIQFPAQPPGGAKSS